MIILTKNYDDELRYNSLLLLSVAIVSIAMVLVFKSAKYMTISPVLVPEQKEKKTSISIVMASVAPAPKVVEKVAPPVKQPAKPVVKKPTKPVVKKVAPPIVEKPAITEIVKEEAVVEEVQPSEVTEAVKEPLQEEVVAAAAPTEVTKKSEPVVEQVSTAVNAELKEDYIAGLYKILSQNKRYPRMAKRRHLEGVAHIHFTVLKNGNLDNVYIAKACGHKSLDKAALKLVKSIENYKPIPDEVSRVAMNIKIPITYSLKERY